MKTFTAFVEEHIDRPLTETEKGFVKYIEENPDTKLGFPRQMRSFEGLRIAYEYMKKGGNYDDIGYIQ